jgi:hypothetical protein
VLASNTLGMVESEGARIGGCQGCIIWKDTSAITACFGIGTRYLRAPFPSLLGDEGERDD